MLNLPAYALEAISTLEAAGFEAYVVGGCVRDMLMGKEISDIDITTNALPEETKKVFCLKKTIDTGIKHGTVTVLIDRMPVEITTYRIDKGYSDGRHPDSVAFTRSLKEDLARRDFTVNAIAYNPKTGIVDPFEGEYDIKNMIIRCVGQAEKRFGEDALRILRGLRFSSVLGFTLEAETMSATINCRQLLKNVSAERIYSELSKMLCGKDIRRVLLTYAEVFEEILPELKGMNGFNQRNYHHCFDVLAHTAAVVSSIEPVPHLRFAALFHDCGKPDCFSVGSDGVGHFYKHARKSTDKAEAALTRLKSDNFTKNRVMQLVKLHDTPIEPKENVIKKKLGKYGEELFFELIKLQRADNMGMSPDFRYRQETYGQIEAIAREILSTKQCFSLKDLAVNGNDLKTLGISGKDIGLALKKLLSAVIDGKAENTKEALILYYHTNVKSI
ncbi:MAG: CCA tRNA nucleotidyltransferase [Clostridia bacterium]|nr:CCA tRNA nucleotidyltransferase [Clostridia bacterium]